MVLVNILLVSARTGKARSLGSLKIINDGTGDLRFRNYDYEISKFGERGTWKKGNVKGLDTSRRGPWDLLYMILKKAVGGRNA